TRADHHGGRPRRRAATRARDAGGQGARPRRGRCEPVSTTVKAAVGEPISYRIVPIDPHAHLFEVTLTIRRPDPDGQQVALPAWIPGSYMIREFARHVVSISARSGARAVRMRKLDKHSWQAARCD